MIPTQFRFTGSDLGKANRSDVLHMKAWFYKVVLSGVSEGIPKFTPQRIELNDQD